MLIKKNKLRAFCKGLRNLIRSPPAKPDNDDQLHRCSFYFNGWAVRYEMMAMAAFDLGFGLQPVRELLANSAWACIGLQRHTRSSVAYEAMRTLFWIGTCHDPRAAFEYAVGYLYTPEGRRGERSPRGFETPYPDDHFWHLANALALFHAGDAPGLTAALDELRSLPPRKQWKYSDAWFKAMTALAVHCLTSPAPDPWELLRAVAEINQKKFARDHKDLFYEAWFGEIAMSFACAAQQRGWVVPEEDPHPSMPLALLRLPPMPVPDYPWWEPPAPPPELVKAIERVAKGLPAAQARKPALRRKRSGGQG